MGLGEVKDENGDWKPLRSLAEILPDVIKGMDEARRDADAYDRELIEEEKK